MRVSPKLYMSIVGPVTGPGFDGEYLITWFGRVSGGQQGVGTDLAYSAGKENLCATLICPSKSNKMALGVRGPNYACGYTFFQSLKAKAPALSSFQTSCSLNCLLLILRIIISFSSVQMKGGNPAYCYSTSTFMMQSPLFSDPSLAQHPSRSQQSSQKYSGISRCLLYGLRLSSRSLQAPKLDPACTRISRVPVFLLGIA